MNEPFHHSRPQCGSHHASQHVVFTIADHVEHASDESPVTALSRIAWIDIARGIGILLVVLGHLIVGLPGKIIFAFHMPFFFFVSGYVHKVQSGYSSFFRKRSINLLIPYATFLILLAPLEFFRASHAGRMGLEKQALGMLWGGNHLRGDYGVFWFITCLFATQMIANWLLTTFRPGVVAAISAMSICLAYANASIYPWFTIPLDLNVVVGALPFFIIGYFSRKVDLDRWAIAFAAILGVIATVFLAQSKVAISYDMKNAFYGVPVLSLLLAACCTVFLIRISKLILFVSPIAKMLERIGAASIGMMFIHKPLCGILGLGGFALAHPYLAFLVNSLIAYGCTVGLSRFRLGRALFLGSQKDLKFLLSNWICTAAGTSTGGSRSMTPDRFSLAE